jgi:hypothetical protein
MALRGFSGSGLETSLAEPSGAELGVWLSELRGLAAKALALRALLPEWIVRKKFKVVM